MADTGVWIVFDPCNSGIVQAIFDDELAAYKRAVNDGYGHVVRFVEFGEPLTQ